MLIGTTASSPKGLFDAAVLIGGTAQPLYRRIAGGALFTAGWPGAAYTLRVRAIRPGRIEMITTVDGRNTLKDEPGDAEQNLGLVFTGHHEFTGWRISDQATREFTFGAPERSVAARAAGPAANTGIVGFAAYQEAAKLGYGGVLRSRAVAAAPPASAGGGLRSGLGTGIGERREDVVGSTHFERAPGAPDILVIRYDTAEALEAMGITGPAEPQAFPGGGTGYERYAGL